MTDVHGSRTYRGSSVDELLSRIKDELGDDAVVVRQRERLVGGVGSFFRKRFFEIDAMPATGTASGSVHDGPELDTFAAELAAAEARPPQLDAEPARDGDEATRAEADPDIDLERAGASAPASPPIPGPSPPAPSAPAPALRPAEADVVEYALATRGVSPEFARELVAEAVTHGLAFLPRQRLARAVRETLARRLPVLPPRPEAGMSLAVVGGPGAGATSMVARLAGAYAGRSDLPVLVLALAPLDGGATLRAALAQAGLVPVVVETGAAARAAIEGADPAVVLIDTPSIDPDRPGDVEALHAHLRAAEVDEVHVALAATLSVPAAAAATDGMAKLSPTGVVLTRVDESEFVGGLLEMTIRRRLPVAYMLGSQTFAAGDPRRLAGMVLP
jgi:hypothetical protein